MVIPAFNYRDALEKVLVAVNQQYFLPMEIVIVDSSTDNSVHKLIEKDHGSVPIVYHKVDKAYPGEARNIGARLAKGDWLAFLDSKTVPLKDWLYKYKNEVLEGTSQVIFGVTKYLCKNKFQELLRAATFGRIGHETTPGTIIKKENFFKSEGFIENVRTADDIEWRKRIKLFNYRTVLPSGPSLTYSELPNRLIDMLKKYFVYSFHTAKVDVQTGFKDAYLSVLLILIVIILPKWNHIIGGWNTNPLFIPHVTKITMIALIIVFLLYKLFSYLFFRNTRRSIFTITIKAISFIFVSFAVYRWNAVIAGWAEEAVLYIPHITKIYASSLIIGAIIFRGIIRPLKRNIRWKYIFPLRWILIGLIGVLLDIVKAPGYTWGAILEIMSIQNNMRSSRDKS